ncbi:MAG: DNA-processing protein DprA [Alysiella sp.]|uniref:DNA-processing protein DprA n=1 Tax=Alysiella sp. TaxID=1872483 RepID=UPI0026DCB231|nr:DNA-processing protein DprA [Alysiella sp.]MDO4434010.1 DNA-processing protein DprA [Alysiella sp.]
MTDTERHAWLQLALTPYIGAESFATLLAHYGSANEALCAPAQVITQLGRHGKQAAATWSDTTQAQNAADAALKWENETTGARLMLACDADFPNILREGITPPPLLFLRGNTELLQRPAVAIVGSRHATPQAIRIAHDFGRALSENGITVVSGMAAGIDTAAHQGALSGSGSTITIWGTGINRVYPPSNRDLAHRLAEQGLIVSEFPLDTRPLAGNFPRRNRLIAAQSHAVLVVEAALESGSLITARLAAEMGREVMAVPGSIDNPHSKGCHKLIKEGAKLVECLDDIISECLSLQNLSGSPKPINKLPEKHNNHKQSTNLSTTPTQPTPQQTIQPNPAMLPEKTKHTLLQAMGYDPIHPDNLAQNLCLPAADIYAMLLECELDGQVAALSGGRYQRIK